MENIILFLLLLIFNVLFVRGNILKCGDRQIQNCRECSQTENLDSCSICEDEHFSLLENLFCIPCNDSIFGQVGCKGECDSKDYALSGFVYCKECKEGFFNLEGICHPCDTESPGCTECTYEYGENSGNKIFKCQKCINDEEYRIDTNHKCVKCNQILDNCKKCHFLKDKDFQAECDECLDGYYVNQYKTCSSCNVKYITGGKCKICSANSQPEYCECYSGYILADYSCVNCPENCDKCFYNKEINSIQCLNCQEGYLLDDQNKCIPCEKECRIGYLDKDKNFICLICLSYEYIPKTNKCLVAPVGCNHYEFDYNKNEIVCLSYSNQYIFDQNKNEYVKCNKVIGDECQTCSYNELGKKYDCLSCSDYNGIQYTYDYVYVTNLLKCFSNTKSNQVGLYGCIRAEYNNILGTYQCLKCKYTSKYHFILVSTDKSCIIPTQVGLSDNCLEAEKIGDKYSCGKCDPKYVIVENISTKIKNCYQKTDQLRFCLEGKLENNKFACTKCDNNSTLKNGICSCNSNRFSKDKETCYKCNDIIQGIPGCDERYGCEYLSYYNFKCTKCKDGYYKYSENKCSLCSTEIRIVISVIMII